MKGLNRRTVFLTSRTLLEHNAFDNVANKSLDFQNFQVGNDNDYRSIDDLDSCGLQDGDSNEYKPIDNYFLDVSAQESNLGLSYFFSDDNRSIFDSNDFALENGSEPDNNDLIPNNNEPEPNNGEAEPSIEESGSSNEEPRKYVFLRDVIAEMNNAMLRDIGHEIGDNEDDNHENDNHEGRTILVDLDNFAIVDALGYELVVSDYFFDNDFDADNNRHYCQRIIKIENIQRFINEVNKAPEERNFDNILGGFIQDERNLSHFGSCFVHDDAVVYGNAKICDDAQICEDAYVYCNAEIGGETIIRGSKASAFNKCYKRSQLDLLREAYFTGKKDFVLTERPMFLKPNDMDANEYAVHMNHEIGLIINPMCLFLTELGYAVREMISRDDFDNLFEKRIYVCYELQRVDGVVGGFVAIRIPNDILRSAIETYNVVRERILAEGIDEEGIEYEQRLLYDEDFAELTKNINKRIVGAFDEEDIEKITCERIRRELGLAADVDRDVIKEFGIYQDRRIVVYNELERNSFELKKKIISKIFRHQIDIKDIFCKTLKEHGYDKNIIDELARKVFEDEPLSRNGYAAYNILVNQLKNREITFCNEERTFVHENSVVTEDVIFYSSHANINEASLLCGHTIINYAAKIKTNNSMLRNYQTPLYTPKITQNIKCKHISGEAMLDSYQKRAYKRMKENSIKRGTWRESYTQ